MPEPSRAETGARIAVVDDDALFRESVCANLEEVGYQVASFGDGASVLEQVTDEPPFDLVLLDWQMPGMNGIQVLRHLRDRGVEIPVIFLTVLSDQIFEEAALTGGAVDFIEKSRSFTIIHKRIALHLGRLGQPVQPALDDDSVAVGALTVKRRTKRAFWNDKPIPLTVTEFDVVRHLSDRAGEDVSSRELYDQVRGTGFHAGDGDTGYRTNVRALIKRIRQKFRDVDPSFDRIGNYPGFGYRWEHDTTKDA